MNENKEYESGPQNCSESEDDEDCSDSEEKTSAKPIGKIKNALGNYYEKRKSKLEDKQAENRFLVN